MTIKNFLLIAVAFLLNASMCAQEIDVIQLNAPDKTRGSATMKALSDRHSDREYDTTELSLQDLSDLLWAANGINREDGRRTAPSAMNRQDIDIYVVRADGTYLYDAQGNKLQPVAAGDHRSAVAGGEDFVLQAPVSLVLVSKMDKLGDPNDEMVKRMASLDAGIVSQNINIFCAAAGLSTVPRIGMDETQLKKVLKLEATQKPLINNPVGYPKK